MKLSDFGIARAEADASLTQTGLVTGSPAYLAPEVASGQMATTASDVWSLGATLFHALAGRPPYEVGDNLMGALYRIVHEEPPRLAEAGWLAPLLEATMTRDPGAPLVDAARAGRPVRGSGRDTGPPRARDGGRPGSRPDRGAAGGRAPGGAGARPPSATPGHGAAPRRRGRRPAGRADRLGGAVHAGSRAGAPLRDRRTRHRRRPRRPTASKITSESPSPRARRGQRRRGWSSSSATTWPPPPPTRRPGTRCSTPAFQQASGGIEGYRSFWDTVESARAAVGPGRPGVADGGLHGGLRDGQLGPGLG